MNKYGLVGKTLGHSFSKRFFTEKFAVEGLDAVYSNYEIPEAQEFLDIVKDKELKGLNVTIPYKQAVVGMMDSLSEDARNIGAVNVVRIDHDSHTLKGFNTDVIGFVDSIRPLIKPQHTDALVLGTGGASLAVRYGLHKLGLNTLYVSRTKGEDRITYWELTPETMSKYKVVVNCTPLGTYPDVDECADIPYDCLTEAHLLYDLVYNPEETKFLRMGRLHGAVTKNGYEMLVRQAEASWDIWNGLVD